MVVSSEIKYLGICVFLRGELNICVSLRAQGIPESRDCLENYWALFRP